MMKSNIVKYGLGCLTILMLSSSWGCCKKLYPVTEVHKDTTIIKETVVVRDTVLTIPGASVGALIESGELKVENVPSDNRKRIVDKENKQSRLTVDKDNSGNLYIDCDCDTVAIAAKLYDRYRQENRQKETVKTIIQAQKYTPFYIKILAWIGALSLGLTGLLLFTRLKKQI